MPVDPERVCANCGGPIDKKNYYGYCSRTKECKGLQNAAARGKRPPRQHVTFENGLDERVREWKERGACPACGRQLRESGLCGQSFACWQVMAEHLWPGTKERIKAMDAGLR
jgi:hypothetical protein